jgi:hypothetical protein
MLRDASATKIEDGGHGRVDPVVKELGALFAKPEKSRKQDLSGEPTQFGTGVECSITDP